jgi:hypothetical protein
LGGASERVEGMTTKSIPEMTDQEIDAALAEFMGWHTERVTYGHPYFWCTSERLTGQLGCKSVIQVSDWHPHDDLNQVLKCEEFVKDSGFVMDYCRTLVKIVGQSYEQFVYATARQKCEAMLMAIRDEHG